MLHLVRRFFGFVTAMPLSPYDQVFVAESLSSDLQRLFYSQRFEDQRHAVVVAERVKEHPHLIEAALMHDVGKTKVGLGAFGRSMATLWALTSLPIWGEWLTYIDHGPIGAELLEHSGAGSSAISFARCHPGEPPAGFDRDDWERLDVADQA